MVPSLELSNNILFSSIDREETASMKNYFFIISDNFTIFNQCNFLVPLPFLVLIVLLSSWFRSRPAKYFVRQGTSINRLRISSVFSRKIYPLPPSCKKSLRPFFWKKVFVTLSMVPAWVPNNICLSLRERENYWMLWLYIINTTAQPHDIIFTYELKL